MKSFFVQNNKKKKSKTEIKLKIMVKRVGVHKTKLKHIISAYTSIDTKTKTKNIVNFT